MGRFVDEEPRGKFLDDEPSAAAAPSAPPQSRLGAAWETVKESAGRDIGRVKGAVDFARTLSGSPDKAADALRVPMSTALPLALPGGGTVATRLGAFAAGSMLDKPQPTFTGNVAEAAKETVFDPSNPLRLTPGVLETVGQLLPPVLRSLPGMKRHLNNLTSRRFGEALTQGPGGGSPFRTATDIADETTAAVQRRTAQESAYADAQAAHKEATAEAQARAQQATHEGQMDWRAEWARRQEAHRQAVQAAKDEARQATAQATTAQRGQQAEDIRDVIVRNVPQLAPAFEGQGAAAVRGAGAGRARKVLSGLKEETTVALEQGAPGGIVVPSLAPSPAAAAGYITPRRMPIRDALEELSLLGSDRTTQFARNPLDRNIQGAARRHRQGQLRREIQQALEQEQRGLGDVFDRGQTTYKEGFAATTKILEPDASYLPTGEVNLPGIAARIQKPRTQVALGDKLGPERTAAMTGEITAIPREAPRIEPVLPPSPQRPLAVAPVYPDIPPAPARPTQSAADIVMETLFGPPQRILQGRGTMINWPSAQKALQSPEVRALLESHPEIGRAGYERLVQAALGGAKSGAEIPAAGTGRLGGPLMDVLSGREKGAGFATASLPRSLFPNFGAYYPGQPFKPPPIIQMLLDLGAQRGVDEARRPR